MQQYETTFIVDAHLPDDAIEKTLEKFKKIMEEGGAVIQNIDRWGKRRLAYEIARKQYGYYVYVRFEAEGAFIQELEREYKLDDAILRYLTVVVPVAALKQEKRDAEKSKTEKEETGSTAREEKTPSVKESDVKDEDESKQVTEPEASAPDDESSDAADAKEEKE